MTPMSTGSSKPPMKRNRPVLKALIYHNSKCSKSNAALNLLLEHGVQVSTVNYLETPLSPTQLEILLSQLDIEAKSLIRFSEPLAQQLGLSITDIRDENEWLRLLAEYPILIERPIVVINGKAVIARPPGLALRLLQVA